MKRSRALTFGRYDYAAFAGFFAYAAGSVIVPVALVLLARELGFSLEKGGMAAGGALHLGRTVAMVVAMLLCGFAAGRWGKRRSFGAAAVMMGLGILLCALAPGYSLLFFALMVAGVGEGVIEGLATPFVQDLHLDEPGRYLNFAHSFWSIGVLVTVLVSGALMSLGFSWRLMVAAVSLLGFITAALLLLPVRRGKPYPEHPEPLHWRTVWGQAVAILRLPVFWLFFAAMFVAGGGEFCLTFWCASYIQLNFVDAAWAGGVGTACFAGGMVVGRTGTGVLVRQEQLRGLLIGSALGGTVITLFFPLVTNLWVLFGFLFLAGIATAPYWPSIQSYSADRLPQVDTTMLFILLSCAGVPGCGFFTWLMGYLGNQIGGLRAAFYLVPFCYLVLAALITFNGRRAARKPAPHS